MDADTIAMFRRMDVCTRRAEEIIRQEAEAEEKLENEEPEFLQDMKAAGNTIVNFGKFKGRRFCDVALDRNYCDLYVLNTRNQVTGNFNDLKKYLKKRKSTHWVDDPEDERKSVPIVKGNVRTKHFEKSEISFDEAGYLKATFGIHKGLTFKALAEHTKYCNKILENYKGSSRNLSYHNFVAYLHAKDS